MDTCNKVLFVKNDTSNFNYRGKLIADDYKEYLIFSSYSESVGSFKYYLFDLEKNKMYSSKSVQETQVPFIFSFDSNSLSMDIVSYDPPTCGNLTKLYFYIEEFKYVSSDFVLKRKVKTRIDL
jgi:hypothetical protein